MFDARKIALALAPLCAAAAVPAFAQAAPQDASYTVTRVPVSLADLDAANAGTNGYKNFIVGVTIVIPGKPGEC
jgi:hypothetical protein